MKINLKEGSKLNLKKIHVPKEKKKVKFNLKWGSKVNLKQIYSVTKEKKK